MDYTHSESYSIHTATGHRMHQASLPLTTRVTPDDMNQVSWELMELLAAAGLSPITFDPDAPASYQQVRQAVQALATGIATSLAMSIADAAVVAGLASIASKHVPVGTVITGYFTAAPTGFLLAQGQLVARADFAALWTHVVASGLTTSDAAWTRGIFSVGDGATNFRLPDLRGDFSRFADMGAGVDPGRAVGSWQADEIRSHTHSLPAESGGSSNLATPTDTTNVDEQPTGNLTGATGGAETRPRNVALTGCIKY